MKRILGTVLLACALAGCTSAPSSTEKKTEEPEAPTKAAPPAYSTDTTLRPVWRTRLDVIGQPVVVGDVAVVLVRRDGGVAMVALDRDTGRELWRRPYDYSAFATGSSLSPVVTRDADDRELVVLRQPAEKVEERGFYYAPLMAVLPRSGKVVGETGRSGVYYACSDGHDVCLDGWHYYSRPPSESGDFGPVTGGAPPSRWDPLRPRRDNETLGGPDATFRVASPDVYTTRMGPPRILRLQDGEQLWSRTLAAAFGPRSSSDNGWSFSYVDGAEVLTGAVGRTFEQGLYDRFNRGRPVSYRYDELYQVVGLDASTGERTWRIAGANAFCAMAAQASAVGTPPVACVVQGRATEQQDEEIRRRGLASQLMGYDPATGEPTWSVELDRRTTEESVLGNLVVRAPGGVVVGTGDGLQAVDLEDGAATPVNEDLVTFCSDGVEELEDAFERNGGTLLFTCTPDGEPATGGVSEFGVASAPASEGWRVVSVEGRVLGYQLD